MAINKRITNYKELFVEYAEVFLKDPSTFKVDSIVATAWKWESQQKRKGY